MTVTVDFLLTFCTSFQDPDRPSATGIVQAMMEREENEKRRERERGVLLTNCRVLERKLRAEKDVVLERMDACHRELKGGEQDFYDKVHRLDRVGRRLCGGRLCRWGVSIPVLNRSVRECIFDIF
jgi:hypothetical protein